MGLRNCFSKEKNVLVLLPLISAFLAFPDLLKLFVLNSLKLQAETQPAMVLTGMTFESLEMCFKYRLFLLVFPNSEEKTETVPLRVILISSM